MTQLEKSTTKAFNELNIHYVYVHKSPYDSKIMYVGKGCYGRAWDVTRCARYNHTHVTWLKELSNQGYIPTDWVQILSKNLSEYDAFQYERELINEMAPEFNMAIRGSNNHWAKLNEDKVTQIKYRLANKESHQTIADNFGVSRAAISMINTGRNWKHVSS